MSMIAFVMVCHVWNEDPCINKDSPIPLTHFHTHSICRHHHMCFPFSHYHIMKSHQENSITRSHSAVRNLVQAYERERKGNFFRKYATISASCHSSMAGRKDVVTRHRNGTNTDKLATTTTNNFHAVSDNATADSTTTTWTTDHRKSTNSSNHLSTTTITSIPITTTTSDDSTESLLLHSGQPNTTT